MLLLVRTGKKALVAYLEEEQTLQVLHEEYESDKKLLTLRCSLLAAFRGEGHSRTFIHILRVVSTHLLVLVV